MFHFLVNAQGGLTTAGYTVSILAVVLFAVLIFVLLKKGGNSFKMSTQQLVTCAIALALAYVTSYIRVFKLPFGGSVTLFSMLFIVLIGYWYGLRIGLLTGWSSASCSSFRSLTCFPFSRYAVIISGVCGSRSGRTFQKREETRSDQGLYPGSTGPRRFPRSGRLSLLDELHAGELPEITDCRLSHRLQLLLSAGGRDSHSHRALHSSGLQSPESGAEPVCPCREGILQNTVT